MSLNEAQRRLSGRAIAEDSATQKCGRSALSRRALLSGAGAVSALCGAVPRVWAGRPDDPPADVDPNSLIMRLVQRITCGLNQDELAAASAMGYSRYLVYQLKYTEIDDRVLDARLATLTTLSMTQQQQYTLSPSLLSNELTEATILRSVLSRRQLYQRMVEFWTDHFSIDIEKEPCNWLKSVDDRDVIRPNALGNFGTMLRASAHSPAMLTYLDNQTSTAVAPNENYAREIMELHTLGVDGGYTQMDVHEVCRCFSGWGYDYGSMSPTYGNVLYTPVWHDDGPKTIFAGTPQEVNIPAGGGPTDMDVVLTALVNHPSTARFIAKKMAAWLLGENPSQAVVDMAASAYTATGGDIGSMIRAILRPDALAAAPVKFKRPYHLMVSALRSLPTTITSTPYLRTQLDMCGHRCFFWPTPDGYPDSASFWQALLLPRCSFGALLMDGDLGGVSVDYTAMFTGLTTARALVDRIDQVMFGGTMPASDKENLRRYLLPDPVTSDMRKRDAIGLAIGLPGYQWY